MSDTVYVKVRFNTLKVQIFYATRQNPRDRKLQTQELVDFWSKFFKNSGADVTDWIRIDG